MMKKITIKIENIRSQNDKALIETEIDVLEGVKNITVEEKTGRAWIEFDEALISEDKILKTITSLGYKTAEEIEVGNVPKKHLYFVEGMHCSSCELLIEKKLLRIKGVKSVEANAGKGEVLVEYIGKRPKTETLNSIFRKENYVFFDQPIERGNNVKENNFFKIFAISILLIFGFLSLNKLGLSGWINVSSKSSLPAFFVLGVIAGVSSCAALVGGLILSVSKQWLEIYSHNKSIITKLQPHLIFHTGRIISYGIFGAIVGAIGSRLQISLGFTSFLIIAVSIIMLFLALQMLGVKAFRQFQFALPKFVTRYIAEETNFKGRYMPALLGAFTFFLPCGFTVTLQGLALISGNPLQSGVMMALFALGTAFPLLLIGFSTIKFSSRPHLAYQFSKVAGILILFFALFNINNQLNVLGFPSLNNLNLTLAAVVKNSNADSKISDEGLAPVVNGRQILKMEAFSYGYFPNYFKVKSGVPVRWEITDKGTSGCTNVIISRGLFEGEIPLTPGQTSIKEFTPTNPGKYKFSCWMGMISGVIEVVDTKSALKKLGDSTKVVNAASTDNGLIPSGARGCGCGGRSCRVR